MVTRRQPQAAIANAEAIHNHRAHAEEVSVIAEAMENAVMRCTSRGGAQCIVGGHHAAGGPQCRGATEQLVQQAVLVHCSHCMQSAGRGAGSEEMHRGQGVPACM
jgi:hypothetical protein